MTDLSAPRLPEAVRGPLDEFLRRVDADQPGTLTGCYVVGSLALGDFTTGASNIDVVVVADQPWAQTQRRAVTKKSRGLRRHAHPATVRFVTWAELANVSGDAPGRWGVTDLDPFNRDVLSDAPVLRGPARPRIAHRPGAIEAWAVDLLSSRWAPWASSARHRPAKAWMKRSLADPVLEVGRLYAASRGDVLSKTQAAYALIADLPSGGGRKVLSEALSYREGVSSSMYWGPVERKRDALALVSELAGRAAAPTN